MTTSRKTTETKAAAFRCAPKNSADRRRKSSVSNQVARRQKKRSLLLDRYAERFVMMCLNWKDDVRSALVTIGITDQFVLLWNMRHHMYKLMGCEHRDSTDPMLDAVFTLYDSAASLLPNVAAVLNSSEQLVGHGPSKVTLEQIAKIISVHLRAKPRSTRTRKGPVK